MPNIKVLPCQRNGISHSHKNYNCKASKINNAISVVFTVHTNVTPKWRGYAKIKRLT